MTNWGYPEGVLRFYRILKAEGILESLEQQHGARYGDLFHIADYEFTFQDTGFERKFAFDYTDLMSQMVPAKLLPPEPS